MQQNNQPHNDQNRPPLTAENAEFVMLALLVSRERSIDLEARESGMYRDVMRDVDAEMVRRGGVIVEAQSPAVDTDARGPSEISGSGPADSKTTGRAAPPRRDRIVTGSPVQRMDADEFVRQFMQELGQAGRTLATVRTFHILSAVESALESFGYEGDIQAMGRMTHVIEDLYSRYRRLAERSNATESDLSVGIRRELVSALTARGPFHGIGANRIALISS